MSAINPYRCLFMYLFCLLMHVFLMEILSLYRSVYEGGELDQFKGRLNNHITNHDKEIERMCNYHYQGFIDSIRELLKVSTDAAQLKVWKYIFIYYKNCFRYRKNKLDFVSSFTTYLNYLSLPQYFSVIQS